MLTPRSSFHSMILYSSLSLHDTKSIKSPPRPTHRELLEKEYERDEDFVDVLSICHRIVALGRDVIVRREFQKGTPESGILDMILSYA